MDSSIKAGISGFLVAFIIDLSSPVYLYFVPSFFAAIIAIYSFRLGTLKDGLLSAFMTYIFTDAVLNTISAATFYFSSKPYPSFDFDVWTMISPVVSAGTAVIAGYMGPWLARKRRPTRELQLLTPPSMLLA